MQSTAVPDPLLPLGTEAVFDVQDDLLIVCNDLDRLRGLLTGACSDLANGFHEASAMIAQRRAEGGADAEFLQALERRLSSAVTALQFEDMATQLINHTCRILRSGADRLAAETFGAEDGEAVVEERPRRPNPVTQDEMDAGSIELF